MTSFEPTGDIQDPFWVEEDAPLPSVRHEEAVGTLIRVKWRWRPPPMARHPAPAMLSSRCQVVNGRQAALCGRGHCMAAVPNVPGNGINSCKQLLRSGQRVTRGLVLSSGVLLMVRTQREQFAFYGQADKLRWHHIAMYGGTLDVLAGGFGERVVQLQLRNPRPKNGEDFAPHVWSRERLNDMSDQKRGDHVLPMLRIFDLQDLSIVSNSTTQKLLNDR